MCKIPIWNIWESLSSWYGRLCALLSNSQIKYCECAEMEINGPTNIGSSPPVDGTYSKQNRIALFSIK